VRGLENEVLDVAAVARSGVGAQAGSLTLISRWPRAAGVSAAAYIQGIEIHRIRGIATKLPGLHDA
jgi:hypothetical protein